MPTPESTTLRSDRHEYLTGNLLTPPPENLPLDGRGSALSAECRPGQDADGSWLAQDDNTASGMSLAQEYSMYEPSESNRPESSPLDSDHLCPTEAIVTTSAFKSDEQVDGDVKQDIPLPGEEKETTELASTLPVGDDVCREGTRKQQMDFMLAKEADKETDVQLNQTSQEMTRESETSQSTSTSQHSLAREEDSSNTASWDFSHIRLTPHYPCSFLRPGSHFSGHQQSDRQVYNVDVTILTLSIPESTLTGYLKICGLTEDHPTLTTFFTGEIIGGPNQKYSFKTKHPNWGATDKTDLEHWGKFQAWRPLKKEAKGDIDFRYPPAAIGPGAGEPEGWWEREDIFMRWKEWFLVPDHRVRSIQGASFEGFYYICFNQVHGKVSGIYFHARSEK